MTRNNHLGKMKAYIENIMCFGKCKITHKDILRETTANCCYSVLKGLKRYYDIDEKWIEKENCRYKEYTIKRKETDNASKINIRRECSINQLSLI